MSAGSRRDMTLSSAPLGFTQQGFASGLPPYFIPEAKIISPLFYGFGKADQHPTINLGGEHSYIAGSPVSTDPNGYRFGTFESAREGSSLSGTSTDTQTTHNVPSNRNMPMGIQLPSSHNLRTCSGSSPPQGEVSIEKEGEATKESNKNPMENKNQLPLVDFGSSEQDQGKMDTKVLRRLAQNREAARKSRVRKKAYVQQLESSRVKLNQLEQELERVRQQRACAGGINGLGDHGGHPGIAAFNMDYARWVEEKKRHIDELRSALSAHVSDNELRALVDSGMSHYTELFCLKGNAIKVDVFHIISGMWKTPAERCFIWMGGFRPSELLKILIPQLEPLTEQQFLAVCKLQQSSQQSEDALSQGMEALQQSLADTLTADSLLASSNVTSYMGQMAIAMGKLGTLESIVRQADNLRLTTLQQMHRVLTTRQAARGLLAMGDYFSRLRALSSLWVARPRH